MNLSSEETVACRVSSDLKQKVVDYAFENDLTVSQLIRRGLKLIVGQSSNDEKVEAGWMVG